MNFALKVRDFALDEDGAVTVDWVVLTAAVVALGIGAVSMIETSTDKLVTKITKEVDAVEVVDTSKKKN